MRIADVQVIALEAAISQPVESSVGRISSRSAILVRVVDESGMDGIGEVWINFPPWGLRERRITVEEGIRPLVLGKRFDTPLELWRVLRTPLERLGRQCGNLGLLYQAISGVEIALWDVLGKLRDEPVYKLLQHDFRLSAHESTKTRVPIYASGLGPQNPEPLVQKFKDLGVQGFKLKVGVSDDDDRKNLAAIRHIIGDEPELMVDVNQGWSEAETKEWLPILSGYGVRWLEEPIRCDDLDGFARLRSISPIPLAGGENVYGPVAWDRFLSSPAVDIVQPDVCKAGGLSEAMSVAKQAQGKGLIVVPHYLGGGVGLVASLHFFLALGESLLFEYDANPNPLREGLLQSAPQIKDGQLYVTEGPGLGVTLNKDTINQYAVPKG